METRDASWRLSKQRWMPNSLYLKVFEEALRAMRKLDICSIYGVNKRFRKSWTKNGASKRNFYLFFSEKCIFGGAKILNKRAIILMFSSLVFILLNENSR
jgi:hypothetical protein